jgi:hypothetical protein
MKLCVLRAKHDELVSQRFPSSNSVLVEHARPKMCDMMSYTLVISSDFADRELVFLEFAFFKESRFDLD